MSQARARANPQAEAGFALVEVLVSAAIVVLMAGAVFGLITATAHSAAEERHRSEAYAIAQEDQARLRSLRVPSLNRLSQTRTVTLNGTAYTVESSGVFVNDKTGTSSCGQGTSSADYIKISSTVSWPSGGTHAPVTIASIVAPPTGSLDPSHGTLTVSATNAQGTPIPGIGLTGTGAGTFSGTTDENGCAIFPDQPSGNYTLTPSGVATGLIDQNGNPPAPQTVSVIAGSTNTVSLLYDKAGAIPVKFNTYSGGSLVPSSSDTLVAFNTGMTTAKVFGNPGGARLSEIKAEPLFPFTSPDTVYAGSCSGDNPNPKGESNPPGAAAMASVNVPAGASAATTTIQLPALSLTVWTGKNAANPGVAFSAADVWTRDDNCSNESGPITRRATTTATGKLPDPGLPWSTYEVCADSNPGSGASRRQRFTNVAVQNLTATGTVLNAYLGEGSGAVSESGACP